MPKSSIGSKNTLVDAGEAACSSVPFTRADLGALRVIQKSGWKNAGVFVVARDDGSWVIKDFSDWPLVLRVTLGAWMVSRELAAFRKLEGVEGVPQEIFRLDRYAFGYRFIPGKVIAHNGYKLLPREFFHKLEKLVRRIHDRGLVHLDLRGRGNMLVTEAGEPVLLDFTSHLDLRFLPPFVRTLLKDIDLSGVYKHWSRRYVLDPERKRLLARMDRARVFWLFADVLRVGVWAAPLKTVLACPWRCAAAIGNRAANSIVFRRFLTRLRVPLYLAGAFVFILAARPRWFVPALVVSVLGEALQVWCFASLDKNRSIASDGPYAFSRNPMYMGRFLLALGMCVLTGSFYLTAGFAICYYFYAVNRVRREEFRLRTIFGSLYEEYCSRVPRFIPLLRRWPGEHVRRFEWGLLCRNHGLGNAIAVIIFYSAVACRVFFFK